MKVSYEEAMRTADAFTFRPYCKNQNAGFFTCLRVDRETLPEGVFAYDIRENGDTGNLCSVEDFVLVNHAGTFLTRKKIKYPKGKSYISLKGRGGYTFGNVEDYKNEAI